MSLSESTILENIQVAGPFSHIQFDEITIINRDGIEISRTIGHSHCIAPGDDCTDKPASVLEVVAIFHTPEVIAAYQAHLAASQVK
jgi:hypothetical protein